MKDKIINNLMKIIKENNNIEETKLLEIKYGLETIYLTIVKTIVFILIAIFLNTIKEILYLMLFYGILRLTGFGVHAHKSSHCWISSILIFILMPIIIKYIIINKTILYIGIIISMLLFILYAPADTPKRPLVNKKKRIIYKLLTLIFSIIYVLIIINNKNNIIINSIFYSMLLESFLVTPFAYKLFGVSYKNYKKYKKKKGVKKWNYSENY